MDMIKIKDLEIHANHGVFPEEVKLGQLFLVSAELRCDLSPAGRSDDLTKSIDYGSVCHDMVRLMTEKNYALLETCAEVMARELLIRYPMMDSIALEIKKPWAPIGLPLDTASVFVERAYHQVYLSIGSNMGDRKAYLDSAVEALGARDDIKDVVVSSYIETEPYGNVQQDVFLNGAVSLKTLADPQELLHILHEIEVKAKRERKIHWGPRTLDLDIIFYDDLVLRSPDLMIPHVEMHKRAFVLERLAELCPEKNHPYINKTVWQLLQEVKEN